MNQKRIEIEQEYKAAIQRIDEIFHAPAGSPESDELKKLVALVQEYEGRGLFEFN